jgi:hypothetical protein
VKELSGSGPSGRLRPARCCGILPGAGGVDSRSDVIVLGENGAVTATTSNVAIMRGR